MSNGSSLMNDTSPGQTSGTRHAAVRMARAARSARGRARKESAGTEIVVLLRRLPGR